MKINWYGQSCFKIQNKEEVVLIDPHRPRKQGLRGPNFQSTLLLLTNPEDKDSAKKDAPESFLIYHPGEYEVRGIFIYATEYKRKNNKNIIYQIEIEKIKYGLLGEINQPLNSQELEGLDGIDVLFVPVGGNKVLNKSQAVEVVNEIEPKIVVPCCYHLPGIKEKLDSLDGFLKEFGAKNPEKVKTLSLKEKDLLKEETRVIILEIATS